jgi:ribosome biogenesis protein Nip4
MRLSISVARSNLVSLGTCLGKFSKSGKFKLHITSLDYLAQYAKYKVSLVPTPFKRRCSNNHDEVWVKPNGEMPFLYGNHVLKAHLGRITEDTPEHQGVVVYSMNDVPLVIGFVFHTICHPQCSFRDSELRPRRQWTHGKWTRQPSSFFIKRTYMQTSPSPSAHAFSFPRDVGEYLRDEVN